MEMKNLLAIAGGNRMIPEGSIKQWPIITEDDEKAVINALRSGALWGRSTPEVKKLQKEWAKYVGVEHCVMTQSGTAALHTWQLLQLV